VNEGHQPFWRSESPKVFWSRTERIAAPAPVVDGGEDDVGDFSLLLS